ncbi:hypothetical protein CMI37_23880 [Candidatus Pacearchaeota archaeon]|nr:hypothetical protein [Candidatus Pacearchaeota archaeon]|tara:strand:+ start:10358 stop:11311 length:954 start_codon:yes stop_codon:yes gene_type:complete
MPIKKKGDKWYWGSKGPFDSRKKAEQVAQAAHSSGYEQYVEHMVNSPVGASDEGVKPPSAGEIARNERLRKEDGGGEGSDNSGAGTVFTSADVHTTTYGSNKKRKHAAGPPRVDRFLDNGTPHIFSKELTELTDFVEKSAFPSDNFESANRMNNPKRLDWKKKRDDSEHSIAHNNLPEGQFYKEDPPAYVERTKNNQDKEKYASYTLAHQDDMEKKIRGYDKESKRKHGDADEPPAAQMGGSASQIDYSGLNKQEGYGPAGQDDELHRTGVKDRIPKRRNDDNEEDAELEYPMSKEYTLFIKKCEEAMEDRYWNSNK